MGSIEKFCQVRQGYSKKPNQAQRQSHANDSISGRLLVGEMYEAAAGYLRPLLERLPDKRLKAVGVLMVLGIIASQSPLISQIVCGVREGMRM